MPIAFFKHEIELDEIDSFVAKQAIKNIRAHDIKIGCCLYYMAIVESDSYSGQNRLETLLNAQSSDIPRLVSTANTNQVMVIPRTGTLSAWSTKALEIAHCCQCVSVKAIEKFVTYTFTFSSGHKEPLATAVTNKLHDPLTETLITNNDQFQQSIQIFENTFTQLQMTTLD